MINQGDSQIYHIKKSTGSFLIDFFSNQDNNDSTLLNSSAFLIQNYRFQDGFEQINNFT
jgi:hypothetical protein